MAGQDMQRREVLRILGVAAVASHFPGFVNWAYANEHADPTARAPDSGSGGYVPQYFTAPEYALVEMVFEMPEEISGQKHRTVLCQGRVLRRDEVRDCGAVGLAASILDYTFLRQS